MSKAKQNTFLIGYFSVLAVGALGLGYLAFSSSSGASVARENYEETRTKLSRLQKAPIFPKQENVDAKKKQVDEFAVKVAELNKSLMAYQKPLDTAMNNSDLQSKLQKLRDALVTEAKNSSTKLPDNFELGMGTYLSKFPESSAVPKLNAWLEGIHFVVTTLLESGVKEVDSLDRPELPFEAGKNEPAPMTDKEKAAARKAEAAAKAKAKSKDKEPALPPPPALPESQVLERYPFDITFTASNRSVNTVLSKLANTTTSASAPYFYNIRVLRIENEQKTGAEVSTLIQAQEMTDPIRNKPYKVDSTYIFGVEQVKVHLGLDLIRFQEPEKVETK